MTKPKQYWVIQKEDGSVCMVWWRPLAGLQVKDDSRKLDEIEAAALAAGHEVHNCKAYGMGAKTVEAVCQKLGYGWDATHRITVRD